LADFPGLELCSFQGSVEPSQELFCGHHEQVVDFSGRGKPLMAPLTLSLRMGTVIDRASRTDSGRR